MVGQIGSDKFTVTAIALRSARMRLIAFVALLVIAATPLILGQSTYWRMALGSR
jgi:hypothetical protein